ncbi:MAG: hypothetical protein KDC90_18715, partial [Ignavibacteriae bacterium]|nr:hypothetical protein [Ignavibacteriota bacterium]
AGVIGNALTLTGISALLANKLYEYKFTEEDSTIIIAKENGRTCLSIDTKNEATVVNLPQVDFSEGESPLNATQRDGILRSLFGDTQFTISNQAIVPQAEIKNPKRHGKPVRKRRPRQNGSGERNPIVKSRTYWTVHPSQIYGYLHTGPLTLLVPTQMLSGGMFTPSSTTKGELTNAIVDHLTRNNETPGTESEKPTTFILRRKLSASAPEPIIRNLLKDGWEIAQTTDTHTLLDKEYADWKETQEAIVACTGLPIEEKNS